MEPAGRIEIQPWMRALETRAVIGALSAGGAKVRFVGGCVRDAVLGRAVTDIDLATTLAPERVIELLEAADIRAVPTGIAHGTVTAIVGKRRFEITTLRVDVETDGRHADVAFTDDWEADAARRDFTINALFCDANGTLYDPFGGVSDLEAGRIRFVGDPGTRIAEDHLRLLRFFRFYAAYGKPPPDEAALRACAEWTGSLCKLSGERVRDEMLKVLATPGPAEVLGMMAEAGALAEVLPEAAGLALLAELASIEAEQEIEVDPLRRLAALMRDGKGRDRAARVSERWRLSKAQEAALSAMATPAVAVGPGDEPKAQRRALHRLGVPLYRDLVWLAWAERRAAAGGGAEDGERFRAMLGRARRWRPVKFPLRGADVKALGVPAGPEVGRLLAELEAWWEAGDFKAKRKACLEKLRSLAS